MLRQIEKSLSFISMLGFLKKYHVHTKKSEFEIWNHQSFSFLELVSEIWIFFMSESSFIFICVFLLSCLKVFLRFVAFFNLVCLWKLTVRDTLIVLSSIVCNIFFFFFCVKGSSLFRLHIIVDTDLIWNHFASVKLWL